ncbi:hypothetical protein J6590_071756 [Homalodisca vitripennis]|nr:hypothetical protein J6590_071756 [Homalodisca vitripennis]
METHFSKVVQGFRGHFQGNGSIQSSCPEVSSAGIVNISKNRNNENAGIYDVVGGDYGKFQEIAARSWQVLAALLPNNKSIQTKPGIVFYAI